MLVVMDIRWTLAHFFFSVLLVLGDAQMKSEPAAPQQPNAPNMPKSLNSAAAKTKQAAPNKTPAPAPTSSTAPSTDPGICELSKTRSEFALQSLQCTLQHLPKNIADKWKAHMTAKTKNESDLLTEICNAKDKNEDPEFMKTFTGDEKGMVNDTSVLCRIRHTTPSECEVLQLVDA